MKLTFEAGFDIGDLGGLVLAIIETGGNTFNVSITSGAFFLLTDASTATGDHAALVTGYASLRDAIESALNSGTGSGTWAVTFSETTERFTFSHTGGSVTAVSITPTTGGSIVGLTSAVSGALSHVAQAAPMYWIQSDVGFFGDDWSGEYEGGDEIAYDVEAHDGTPGGAAKDGAATYLDLSVPLEPVAKVGNYPRLSASVPWTWAAMWRHCRNVEPIAMRDDDEVVFLLLRAEGSRFRPRAQGGGYIGHWDIPFQTRVLARDT